MSESRYGIARQFTEGFAAAIRFVPRILTESDHWLAGYDAGYPFRKHKNERLNEYLVVIGREPMEIIRLCETSNQQGTNDANDSDLAR